MICPECRNEYREGFYTCPDCAVALVYEVPPDEPLADSNSENAPEYVEVASISQVTAPYVDSLLATTDIRYYFEERHGAKAQPLDAVLWVEKSSVVEVSALLDSLNK